MERELIWFPRETPLHFSRSEPPFRLQLSREKGFNLLTLRRETNEREAVVLGAAGCWENPLRMAEERPLAAAVAAWSDSKAEVRAALP
jgi:hypothetical protein